MARKRHTTAEIVRKLRTVEVEIAKGTSVPVVVKQLGITEQSCYRWRKEYGGLRASARR